MLATLLAMMGWIVLGNGLVFGQGQGTTAAISGVVRDVSGAVVPEATITLRQVETGLTRTAESGVNGGYSVPALPVGPYELTVEKPGFRQQVRMGITLAVGQEAVVNFTLQVGQVQQTVEVTGEAPIVNTTLSSTSGLITENQIKDMPLNGRSFNQLLTLNTGTVDNNSNSGGGGSFSVAGKRPETNRFTINGVDYVGGNSTGQYIVPGGSSGQLLGVEAVREYNVLQHTYGAEYGKRAGAQITVVTSSGTNQLHGDAFEYLRNSALDARDFFDYPEDFRIPPFKRNQFGGALGGPLKRDKMFLFGSYEGFRERLGRSLAPNVPDAQARQGLLPCNVITPAPNPCPASGFAPVPNLVPRMLDYANNFWAPPNGPELFQNGLPSGIAKHFSNPVQKVREDFGLLRFDYTVSSKDSFSANYTMDTGERNRTRANPVFLDLTTQRNQSLGLQETHVFSSNLLSVATFGFVYPKADSTRPPAVPIPADLRFLTAGNFGGIVIGGGASTVAPSAITAAEGINPVRGIRRYATGSDDVRYQRGNHSFSAGFWIQRLQQNEWGSAQFSAGTPSYSTLLTFLQDRPTQFVVNPNPIPVGFRSTEAAWYIQDEIKLRPNLTLRVGLRDEMTNGWSEVAGRCSTYLFDQNGVILTDPRIGPSCLTENNAKALWQPRVGLAWDPTGTGSWAVRAGFGIHNDLQDNLANRTYANPPFSARTTLQGPLLSNIPFPAGTQPPPSCHVVGEPGCSTFQPGGIEPNFHTPTIQQWNFTVERGITNDLMLQLSYVGMEAYHQPTLMNTNVPQSQVCADPQGCISGGTANSGLPVPVSQRVLVPQGTRYVRPQPRPNPVVSSTTTWFYLGTSSYHAANVSLVKRAAHGLTFKVNYTFSKLMDINSAILTPSGTNEPPSAYRYDLKLSRGVGAYSLTHQFNTNFSYPLPFGKGQRFGGGSSGWVDKLISGWQWNGIVNTQSGFPFTPLAGSNVYGTGDSSQADVVNRNPNFKGPVIVGKAPDQWFNPNAFSLPALGTFGDVARGSFIGPKLFNLDTSLFKKFSVNEKWSLQLRAEAFNILNHTNFAEPNAIVFNGNTISGTAGVISTMATTSRQIQFALKLLF